MLRYRLLTFDANNTLIKVRNTVGDHYRKVAKQFGVEVKVSDLNQGFRKVYKDQVQKHPNFGVASGLASEEWWAEVVHSTFRTAGCNCDDGTLVEVASKLYNDFGTGQAWETFPEVKEMLTFCNRNGIALGVLSNNDERLSAVLKSLDLAFHFAFILPSAVVKCEKPSAEFFHMALDRLRVEPGQSAHVGDNVDLDYFAAKAIGMDAYLVDRDGILAEKHPEINTAHILSDIADLESVIFKQ